MRLFGRAAAAELEGRNLRLFFNQATAAITAMPHFPESQLHEHPVNVACGLGSWLEELDICTTNSNAEWRKL